MKRKSDVASWVFMALACLAGVVTLLNVSRLQSAVASDSQIYGLVDRFGEVLEVVRDRYVETPDDSLLIESAINGMLASLDPHSAFHNARNYREFQSQTRGAFGGLGLEVSMEQGVLKIVSAIDDTPAAKAGLQANDAITHLDGESIAGLSLDQAIDKMRGEVNTPVTLTVLRKDKAFDVKIVRDVIKINPIKARLEGDVIYIKISVFNEQTHDNLVKQVGELKKEAGKKVKGFIVDLRNNPGGLLNQAIAVSDDFLDRGTIVLTKSRSLEESQRAAATPGDIADGKRIVVLINGGSASASEIVAGALQDQQRATILGTRSFGKGSVQTIIPLGKDGALRLTTARYYTPSGRSIQAKGIDPDVLIEQELPPELQRNRPLSEASLPAHLRQKGDAGKDVKEERGSSAYVPKEPEKDRQLQYALKLVRSGNLEVPNRAQ